MNRETIRRLIQDEEGATATEYSVVIALILLVVIASVVFLGQEVDGLFSDFGSAVAPFMSGS